MMDKYFAEFTRTGVISEDVSRYLGLFGFQKTAEHSAAVAAKAKWLAEKFDSNPHKAKQGGYLHDISAVIPNQKRVDFAYSQKVDVLAEEVQCPMVIHQKLSVVLAIEIFHVTDIEVLSAIECHTTLKAKATLLDKIVFLADKIAWDQDGKPPYISKVYQALEESLDAAVLVYLNYLWARRSKLQIIHPWFIEAREDLMHIS